MTKNFEIPDGISLKQNFKEYDLHSDWIVDNVKTLKNEIRFYISAKNSKKIIIFKNYHIYSQPDIFPQGVNIEYIGYRYDDDFTVKSGFLTEDKFQPDMHMIIKFENNHTPLRFSCEEAFMED